MQHIQFSFGAELILGALEGLESPARRWLRGDGCAPLAAWYSAKVREAAPSLPVRADPAPWADPLADA